MSVGNPKILARVKPVNKAKAEAYVNNNKHKYSSVSDLLRELLLERLEKEGYSPEREP